MLELVIRDKAQRQILDIYSYYEDTLEGLGDSFEKELDTFLNRIEQNPKQFQAVDKVFRKAHLRKFPYSIYFFQLESRVYIVSVWPQHGNPRKWQDEMDEF